MKSILLLLFAFVTHSLFAQKTLTGFVLDEQTKEALPFATIGIAGTNQGTSTNQYGYFAFKLAPETSFPLQVKVDYVGYKSLTIRLDSLSDNPIEILLPTSEVSLQAVTITASQVAAGSTPSRIVLSEQALKAIPQLLGEVDVIRSLQILPGVQKANEGNSGLFVRGGSGDQNLILLDEAPVYNVNHLFGFFSIFNGDAIQSLEFIKGGFPSYYGGRLSSVLSITTKNGNRDKWSGVASAGLTASRVMVSGPILKKKGTLLLSARRTYWDVLTRPFLVASDANSNTYPFFFFNDYNAKLTYDLGEKDQLFLSFYNSADRYGLTDNSATLKSKNGLTWRNYTSTLRWNHVFGPSLFANNSFIFTNYRIKLFNDFESIAGNEGFATQESGSSITDLSLKSDWFWAAGTHHKVRFGGQVFAHIFNPNILEERSGGSASFQGIDGNFLVRNRFVGYESALYLHDEISIGNKLLVIPGIRLASYVADEVNHVLPEPRLVAQLGLGKRHSLASSITRMNQFVHQVSNNGAALPIDVWLPTTARIVPQSSWQYTLGYTWKNAAQGWEVQLEGYYKTINNTVRFLEGTTLLNIDFVNLDIKELRWQELVTQGDGQSRGIELLVRKQTETWNLLTSYTLSKTTYRFDALNNGLAFAPSFDRRHQFSTAFNGQPNERIEVSAVWYFATGNPAPVPASLVELSGHLGDGLTPFPTYAALDAYRSQTYHRLDVSIKFKKKKEKFTRYWELGAYNIYNRLNPTFFDLAFQDNNGTGTTTVKLRKNAFFFITPSISYNIKF